mmetsp:Transcript_78597/g.225217  ORF Transcript_78597/g.225217 Transcript_78597/m.225217 type:complete len:208 (+) Transcript_78597:346-969(+)
MGSREPGLAALIRGRQIPEQGGMPHVPVALLVLEAGYVRKLPRIPIVAVRVVVLILCISKHLQGLQVLLRTAEQPGGGEGKFLQLRIHAVVEEGLLAASHLLVHLPLGHARLQLRPCQLDDVREQGRVELRRLLALRRRGCGVDDDLKERRLPRHRRQEHACHRLAAMAHADCRPAPSAALEEQQQKGRGGQALEVRGHELRLGANL